MKWLLLLWTQTAFAGLTLTLTPSVQPVSAGAEALFSGTLTNTSATEKLFLNDIGFTFSADTTLSSNAFFANVPGILLPGETYDGPLFRIALSNGSAASSYHGTVTFQGGADITDNSALASSGITLLAGPVDQWRHQTFGDEAGSALAADDHDWDHDGTPNLVEYALALNALSADNQLLPAPVLVDDHLTFSFPLKAAGVTYTVESSTDLLQWGTSDVELVTMDGSLSLDPLTVRHKDTISQLGRAFLRLNITRQIYP